MEPPVTALYDATILYPAPLRDLFIRLAQAGLVRARWTDAIHDKWFRNVLNDNPQLLPERLAKTRSLMNEAVRDCLVKDPVELWGPEYTNHCPLHGQSNTPLERPSSRNCGRSGGLRLFPAPLRR